VSAPHSPEAPSRGFYEKQNDRNRPRCFAIHLVFACIDRGPPRFRPAVQRLRLSRSGLGEKCPAQAEQTSAGEARSQRATVHRSRRLRVHERSALTRRRIRGAGRPPDSWFQVGRCLRRPFSWRFHFAASAERGERSAFAALQLFARRKSLKSSRTSSIRSRYADASPYGRKCEYRECGDRMRCACLMGHQCCSVRPATSTT